MTPPPPLVLSGNLYPYPIIPVRQKRYYIFFFSLSLFQRPSKYEPITKTNIRQPLLPTFSICAGVHTSMPPKYSVQRFFFFLLIFLFAFFTLLLHQYECYTHIYSESVRRFIMEKKNVITFTTEQRLKRFRRWA